MPKYNQNDRGFEGLDRIQRIEKHVADSPTLTPAASTDNVVQATSDVITFVLKALSGQTSDLLQFQDSTGARLGGIGKGLSLISGCTYVPSTGVAATDAARFQVAHDAFPATGGTILLDAGPYDWTSGMHITKPLHVIGTGPSQANIVTSSGNQYQGIGTSIVCTSLSATPITIDADGCTFEKLSIINTAADATHHASAGAGILFNTLSKSWRMVDVLVRGFYINVDTVNGKTWQMDRCWNQDPVLYGLRVQDQELPDAGDMIISNSYFYGGPNNLAPDSLIYWASAGGMKLTGNKLVAAAGAVTYAVHLQPASTAATSVIVIVGNSIEDCTNGIQIESTSTSGRVYKVVITGNEIVATTDGIIVAGASTSNRVQSVVITGNVIQASRAYNFSNFDDLNLSANALAGSGGSFRNLTGGIRLKMVGQHMSTTTRQGIAANCWYPGSMVFDSTLKMPLWMDDDGNGGNGTGTAHWRDATGTIVA